MEAIILSKAPADNADMYYTILTPDLGKIRARATSVRKLTSKLAGHLEPGTLSEVRLVQRVPGGPRRLVEALMVRRAFGKRAVEIVSLSDAISPLEAPDTDFFEAVKEAIFSDMPGGRSVLKAAGFDADFARCAGCGSGKIVYFSGSDIIFLCQSCLQKTGCGDEDGFLL